MTQTVVRIDERVQSAKCKEGKYLTFAFLKKGPDKKMELEFGSCRRGTAC